MFKLRRVSECAAANTSSNAAVLQESNCKLELFRHGSSAHQDALLSVNAALIRPQRGCRDLAVTTAMSDATPPHCARVAVEPRPMRMLEIRVTDCLHCDINELVQQHLDRSDPIDLPELAARIAESLVDLILSAPDEQ